MPETRLLLPASSLLLPLACVGQSLRADKKWRANLAITWLLPSPAMPPFTAKGSFLTPDYAHTVVVKMYATRGNARKEGFNESPITGLAYGHRPDLFV